MKNKRAISTLVTTILLILIIASAVTIVWYGLVPILQKAQQEYMPKQNCLNETATAYCQEKGMELIEMNINNPPFISTFKCRADAHKLTNKEFKFTDEELKKCQIN